MYVLFVWPTTGHFNFNQELQYNQNTFMKFHEIGLKNRCQKLVYSAGIFYNNLFHITQGCQNLLLTWPQSLGLKLQVCFSHGCQSPSLPQGCQMESKWQVIRLWLMAKGKSWCQALHVCILLYISLPFHTLLHWYTFF